MDRKKINAIVITIMFIFFVIGVIFVSYNYFIEKRNLAFEKINLQINGNKEVKKVDKTPAPTPAPATAPSVKKQTIKYDYIGILEIPKINLTQGFVDKNSKYNNVDYNLQIIKPSSYPDVDRGNFIIASHSGSSSISYFKHLYKINQGDKVYVHYNNVKYTYEVVKIYKEPKNGYINVYRDITKTTLTLITCTKNDNTTQTVYICNLIEKS